VSIVPFSVQSKRGAYALLMLLTVLWGSNWIFLKFAFAHASPVVFNAQRAWVAVATLFAWLIVARRLRLPRAWWPIVVTGFFQTTLNFGATAMAVAGGGAGRASVLVFTMPFWTLLIAAPVLGERVRGAQWIAIAFALLGLALVVQPWNWQGDLSARGWAVLSGFAWAVGSVLTKYYQRDVDLDATNFIAWQMAAGAIPLAILPFTGVYPATQWSVTQVLLLIQVGAISTALGFLLWVLILQWLPAGTASMNMLAIPVIALVSSMIIFGETLDTVEWIGIACIAAGLALVTTRNFRARWRAAAKAQDRVAG
jgi:drug/metabolite transporter (DMT)-like permease